MFATVPGMFEPDTQALVTNFADFGGNTSNTGAQNTTAYNAAVTALGSTGGILYFGAGTFKLNACTLSSNIYHRGEGIGVTILQLANSQNTDLFSAQTSSINLSAVANTGIVGTLSNFGFTDLTLDGNKANQASGTSYPLRVYGYHYLLQNVEIKNGYTGGFLSDWNGLLSEGMESYLENVAVHDNNGIGVQMGGPHDSRLEAVLSYNNGSHNFHFAPNMNGLQCSNCHAYLVPNNSTMCNWLVEIASGCDFVNCISDGNYYVGFALLGNSISFNGRTYTATSTNAIGFQIGQNAGQTPFAGQINQAAGVTTAVTSSGSTIFAAITGCNQGSVKFVNENNSYIFAGCFQASGAVIVGTPDATDEYVINVNGGATGGGVQLRGSPLQVVNNNVAINTSTNSTIAALIGSGADNHKGLVIFANSGSQSVNLLEVQNSSFVSQFSVDKSGNVTSLGNVVGTKFAGGSSGGVNSGIEFLIGIEADGNNGLVIYGHSATQSAALLQLQNSSFSPVFSVDNTGATTLMNAGTLRSGSGAPSNSVGVNGDYYFRTDTPGTANQRIYVRSAGSYVGIV